MRHDAFGPRQVDALQELASIGCGQAITALGKLAGRRFDMDVPEAWVGAESGAIASFLGALGQPLENVAGISAVTVLGNGRPVFILDVQRLGVA